MTVEQIEKQIDELKEKKKKALEKEKQKKLLEQRKKTAQKRKLESRVKYIIGGYILSVQGAEGYIDKLISSDKLRDQDKKTLQTYKATLK